MLAPDTDPRMERMPVAHHDSRLQWRSDADAFESFYDRHHHLVYATGLRLLGDRTSAEDLTQAVFLKIWMSPGSYSGENVTAWLSRVARNLAIDALRRRSTRPECELPDNDLRTGESIDEIVAARAEAGEMHSALSRLPAEQRELIELGFLSGLTHEELAREKALPLGTVKTRIRTGLKAMRSVLEACRG